MSEELNVVDFDFEFFSEIEGLDVDLIAEAEKRLREMASGHDDMIGASVAMEELTGEETSRLYQARVVAYIRPENIAAVEKNTTPEGTLRGALDALERQVREKRERLRERWQQP